MKSDPFVLGSNRKIDPSRRRISNSGQLPDGTPNEYVRVETGPTDLAFEEDQVVITETGYENLTSYPFETDLLS